MVKPAVAGTLAVLGVLAVATGQHVPTYLRRDVPNVGCFADDHCPRGQYCNPGPYPYNDAGVCGPPPPNGCTTYTVLEAGNEGPCRMTCKTTYPKDYKPWQSDYKCSRSVCIFLDNGSNAPPAPYDENDLAWISFPCSGDKVGTGQGACNTC